MRPIRSFSQILLVAGLVLAAGQAGAQVRCGIPLPQKTEVERSTGNLDTAAFLNVVGRRLGGRFKGYAVIFTGAAGQRLGFRRAGWAVDPCDNSGPTRFDLNTETAIGSVTKLLTTVAALKVTTDSVRFGTPFTTYLPFRWDTHSYWDTVDIADLLRHQAGFRPSWEGEPIWERLTKGREISDPPGTRRYSNSSMGVFHFIYARWAFRAPYHQTEVALQNAPMDTYNREIQKETSKYYNIGLYNKIFRPLRISATCDPRKAQFPAGRPQYFTFHPVARSYGGPGDNRGKLLPSSETNCASGGVYMSAKDLAAFMTALDDPDFLPRAHRDRMVNGGPSKDLWGFWEKPGADGGRSFAHDGGRNVDGNSSIATVVRFPTGAHAVFVANSPFAGIDVGGVLVEAYNAARN